VPWHILVKQNYLPLGSPKSITFSVEGEDMFSLKASFPMAIGFFLDLFLKDPL